MIYFCAGHASAARAVGAEPTARGLSELVTATTVAARALSFLQA